MHYINSRFIYLLTFISISHWFKHNLRHCRPTSLCT